MIDRLEAELLDGELINVGQSKRAVAAAQNDEGPR